MISKAKFRSRCAALGMALAFIGLPSFSWAVTLTLQPQTPLVTPNTHLALSLVTRDDNGQVVSNVSVGWSVSPLTGAATITDQGVLTGVSPGTVKVIAQVGGVSLSSVAYVLSPDESVQLAIPDIEATAGQTIYLPLILSSSPAFVGATMTVSFTSSDAGAPALVPQSFLPADESTVLGFTSSGDGYRMQSIWSKSVTGPLVLGNLQVAIPSSLTHDTNYVAKITSASLTDSSGDSIPVVTETGRILAHTANPGAATTIVVQPDPATLYAGQSQKFTAVATDAAGNVAPDLTFNWSITNGQAGSVDSSGVFQALSAGSATVTATFGSVSGSANVTVLDGTPPVPESLIVPYVDATAGATVDVPVLLGEVDNFSGLSLSVSAQSSNGGDAPTFIEADTGPLASASFIASNKQSDGSQAIALLSSQDIQGPGALFLLRYQIPSGAVGGTSYLIQIKDLDMSDGKGQSILASSVSGGINVRSDETPPTISLNDPASGTYLSGIVHPAVVATDDQSVATVDLYVDGKIVATRSASPYDLPWDTTQSTSGLHVIQARATDSSGNVGWSGQVSVVVDNVKPTATLTSPKSGDALQGVVTITGSASDANFKNYKLRYATASDPATLTDIAGPIVSQVANGTLGAWNTAQVSDGSYLLHLIATDLANNVTDASIPVVVANSDPKVAFSNPPTRPVKGKITLSAVSANGSPLSSVTFQADGANLGQATASPFSLAVDTTTLSDGSHVFKIIGTNPVGKTAEATLTLVVDNSPPALTIVSPADKSRVGASASIQCAVKDVTDVTLLAEAGLGSAPTSFSALQTVTVPAGATSATLSWNTSDLSEGTYLLRLTATDATGNVTVKTAQVQIDHTKPSILVRSPADGSWATDALNLDVEAADAGGLALIQVTIDNVEIARSTTAPFIQTVSISGISEGAHQAVVTVTDAAGNYDTQVNEIHVDRTPPVATISSPKSNAVLLSGDVTVTGTASDPSPGQLASYRLEIGAGVSPTVWQAISTGTASVSGSSLGDFSVNGLAAGSYVLRLVATDAAGNSSTVTTPILVGVTVVAGDVTGDGKITISDATLALRAVVGLTTLTSAQASAADITQDGKLTIADVTKILRIAVGL